MFFRSSLLSSISSFNSLFDLGFDDVCVSVSMISHRPRSTIVYYELFYKIIILMNLDIFEFWHCVCVFPLSALYLA